MFFVKKIISETLLPIPIGIFLIILSLIFMFRKSYLKAKIFLILSCLWFLLLSNTMISNLIVQPLESSHQTLKDTPKDIEFILVLGNGHNTNDDFPITSQLNSTAINRFVEALRHYNNLENAKLILSGYSGLFDENSHAQMQKKLALSLGVKEEDIITFDTPKDTKDEAVETKKLLQNKRVILVTSATHMKRAFMIFKKEGIDVIASPTNHKFSSNKYSFLEFKASNLQKVELAFHEYLGIVYYYLKGDI